MDWLFVRKVEINGKLLSRLRKSRVINSTYNSGEKSLFKLVWSLKCSDFIPSCEGELSKVGYSLVKTNFPSLIPAPLPERVILF